MVDQDDLDILASLADSDFEFEDDDDLGEAICSSNASPKSTSITAGSQTQQQHGEQTGVASALTVEKMAGK